MIRFRRKKENEVLPEANATALSTRVEAIRTATALSRLETVADRLEGVYSKLVPVLPHRPIELDDRDRPQVSGGPSA